MAESIRGEYRSIQDIVFTTLRDEILRQKLNPGDILNTVELSERLGVSRTPIREALNRLISIGLVEEAPHRSACVKKLSVDQIIEIYYIRAALSGIAARLAARNLTEAEINQLFKLCDRMDADIEHGQSKAMLEDNLKFHSIIYKATKSRRLEELALQYHSQSEQYQALGLELPGRYAEICAEHRDLANALAAGDKEGAEFCARQHLFNTAKRIAANFQIDLDI